MAVASLAWELTCDTLMALTRAPDAGPLVVLATTRCRADQLPAGVSDCFYSAQVRVLRRVRARARSQVARLRARLSEAVCCVCLCAGWDVAGMGPFCVSLCAYTESVCFQRERRSHMHGQSLPHQSLIL